MDKMKFTKIEAIETNDDSYWYGDYIEFGIKMDKYGVYLKTGRKADSSLEPIIPEIKFYPWHMVKCIHIK